MLSPIHSRTFHIVGCDPVTREYLTAQCGLRVAEDTPIPEGAFDLIAKVCGQGGVVMPVWLS